MTLSKARNRLRMRIVRAQKAGKPVHLSATDEFDLLPKYKRKERLAELATGRVQRKLSAGECIAAIKELNLMEHVYDEVPRELEVHQTFVFIMPDGTRVTPGEIVRNATNQS